MSGLDSGIDIVRHLRAGPARGAFSKEAIAVLRDQINTALGEAMKGGDARRVSARPLIPCLREQWAGRLGDDDGDRWPHDADARSVKDLQPC